MTVPLGYGRGKRICYTLLGISLKWPTAIGLGVCLEGVETEEELVKLQRLGPDFIQGYLFGRPVPENVFVEKYLADRKKYGNGELK